MTLPAVSTLVGAVAGERRAVTTGEARAAPIRRRRGARGEAAGEPGALPVGALARRCREEAARFACGEPAR